MADYAGAAFIPVDKHDIYPAIDPANANISGQVVVVTGASKGIGRAIAVAMAQGGASGLVLLARSSLDATKAECLAAQHPGQALQVLALQLDIVDSAQVAAAAKQVEETFGRVDVVVNDAGYLEQYNFLADGETDEWWRAFEVNVRGTYLVTRALLPLLVRCGGARTIVNVTSAAAFGFLPRYSAYAVSKLAQLRLAEFIDAEYSDKGVIAFSVHPGVIWTEMNTRLPPEFQAAPIFIDKPQLTAGTILWLVKERREWLSGRFVDCRWDVEALLAKKQEIVDEDKLKVKLAI